MDQLNRERDRAAENALEAIAELRRDLDSAEKNLRSAADGGPAAPSFFAPSSQRLVEVVETAATFGALWRAAGITERSETR